LIVAEKRSRSRERHGQVIRILRLSKISSCRRRSILRSKHTEDEPRAVHDRYNHIHIHGIHGGQRDVLHIGNLQRLNHWSRRRRNRRAASTTASDQQHHQRCRNSQRQDDSQRKRYSPLSKRVPRIDWFSQFVRNFHRGDTCVRITVIRHGSTFLAAHWREV